MTARTVATFEEQSGITTQSDAFVVDPDKHINVMAQLESGTPVTGACLQVTLDDVETIAAGSAAWVNSPMGARTTSGAEQVMRPVTGVRLSVTDGTWALKVRQG